MVPAFIESINEFKFQIWTIRVWREEKDIVVKYDHNHEYLEHLKSVTHGEIDRIYRTLSEIPGVTAIEIKDHFGNGVVYYTQWP